MIRIALAALVAALAFPAAAQAPGTRAQSATPKGTASAPKAVVAKPMRADAASARSVVLARPTSAERAKLAELNGNRTGALSARGRPQFIGFGRDVAPSQRHVDLASLAWTTLDGGARVARLDVASTGAKGIRVALRMAPTHPDVQVRFAGATSVDALESIPANAIAKATARFGEYWSPVIDGERAAIEIEAAADAKLGGTTLEIVRVSHLLVSPMASKAEEAKILADIGDSGSCNINFKCSPVPQDAVTEASAAGTGKLVFTVPSGGTARCTGTMLNDTTNSFAPYIFSANHCFESAYEAFTLNVWWFFDAMACGTQTPANYIVQTGGAALLGRSQDWDWALLRLNTTAPEDVWFRGWDSAPIAFPSDVEIFHHPSGDLKKWSGGQALESVQVDFGTAAGGAGFFTRVVWDIGTTEGGSSGGSFTTFDGTDLIVRGGLLGGDALCSNPDGSDFFSQFGAMLPLVRQYLAPNFPIAGLVVSVEFYHAGLNHFFMTINPAEIAGLDSGVIPGWQRTGFRFLAYDSPGPGRSPVCRFYRKPEFGDSHFFTADPAECATVAANFATDWVFESPAIYYVQLPSPTTYTCPAGTKPIYRFLNTAEINHRFTTEQTVALGLLSTPGWTMEGSGFGPLNPVMCSPVGS